MVQEPIPLSLGWFDKAGEAAQWTVLVALSVVLSAIFIWLGIPAAMLLGPMLAGIAITANGGRLQISSNAFALAQGLIGCMIASMLPRVVSFEIGTHWPLFAVGVLSVIAISGILGWWLTRKGVLPGTTAVWGMSPGAATAMTLMAEANGADTELVALMQYLRVVIVAAVSSVILRLWGGGMHHVAVSAAWFPPVAWLPLIETVALAVLGPVIARLMQIRAGALLIPLIAGIVLVRHGVMTIDLPRWLLVIAYAIFGWRIGLRFSRPLLSHAAKVLPRVIASTFALIVLCGGVAALLVVMGGVDPRTAYLATSPGGADTVAIIAASSNVNVSFVMAMQMLRFVVILVLGPAMARYLTQKAGTSQPIIPGA